MAAPRNGNAAKNAAVSSPSAQPAKPAPGQSAMATITYRKVFKGSTPEFVEIKVAENGAATYDIRQLSESPSPQPFHVSAALTAKIFALAAHLRDFDGVHLNVRRVVANLGRKTFTFEKDGKMQSVSFNYTMNAKANQLVGIFEGLSLEDQYIDELRSSMRYDPLGLDDVLMRLQNDLASNSIAEPQALAPVLEKIVSNRQFLNIARDRARQILDSMGKFR